MLLESLRVIHQLKADLPDASDASNTQGASLVPGSLYLDSCQRRLWICDARTLAERKPGALEIFEGVQAYQFLLRVSCGLESQIVGETDIFGQVKEVWKNAHGIDSGLKAYLGFWMQKLFEDVKELRSRYVQNLGGASYGSLVRRILREKSGLKGPVLLVGAGQIASVVAPFLLDSHDSPNSKNELWLLNRSRERAQGLYQELISHLSEPDVSRVKVIEDTGTDAWARAVHVVICIPMSQNESTDLERASRWKQQQQEGIPKGLVIHLGALKNASGPWSTVEGFHSLDAIFDLQRSQGEMRSIQVARARHACEERAKLRNLGFSLSTAHGWEDLAAFG